MPLPGFKSQVHTAWRSSLSSPGFVFSSINRNTNTTNPKFRGEEVVAAPGTNHRNIWTHMSLSPDTMTAGASHAIPLYFSQNKVHEDSATGSYVPDMTPPSLLSPEPCKYLVPKPSSLQAFVYAVPSPWSNPNHASTCPATHHFQTNPSRNR